MKQLTNWMYNRRNNYFQSQEHYLVVMARNNKKRFNLKVWCLGYWNSSSWKNYFIL